MYQTQLEFFEQVLNLQDMRIASADNTIMPGSAKQTVKRGNLVVLGILQIHGRTNGTDFCCGECTGFVRLSLAVWNGGCWMNVFQTKNDL